MLYRQAEGAMVHMMFFGKGISAMVNFQFHLIARVDDSTQLVLNTFEYMNRFQMF
jgi:hypothetical protein